jgi:hypothetical protein
MRKDRALSTCLVLLAAFAAAPCAAQDVTIYRCVDAKGHLALRDTPCKAGEKQDIKTMQRPVDAPKRHVEPAPEEHHAPAYAEEGHYHDVTYVTPPRPLYECITPDGENYTSDTGDGNPRWVPLWTLGYYPGVPIVGPRVGVGVARGNAVSTIGPDYSMGSGTYVRDTCYVLPQADVCDRVRDRRDEIRTRFFNAMPSERDVLRVEERSLNARLDADCGGR